MQTAIVCIILAVAAAYVVRRFLKSTRKGDCGCGCGCEGCTGCKKH